MMMERGLWREDYLDDWALIFKLAFWHGFRFLPEPLARNRNHSTNLTKQFAQAGRDGILDIVNQVSDVFGDALPATPRLLALRASLDRKVSRMCIRASMKACYRRDWKRAAGRQPEESPLPLPAGPVRPDAGRRYHAFDAGACERRPMKSHAEFKKELRS